MLRCVWSSLMKRGEIVAEVCRRTNLTLFHWRQWARSKCEAVPFDLSTVEKQLLQTIWAYLFLINKYQGKKVFFYWPTMFFYFIYYAWGFPLENHLFSAYLLCLFLTVSHMFLHHSPLFSLWTQCTTSCGPGYQMRAVKCVVGSYAAVMDDTECNAATRPTNTQVRGRCMQCFLNQHLMVSCSQCQDHVLVL